MAKPLESTVARLSTLSLHLHASHELNGLWRYNKKQYSNILFQAASQRLSELLEDPKYLGGRIGLLCALHTWNQTLQEHIHLHVLVTAAGLSESGQWLSLKKSCLLPRKVLMIKFRGKFKAILKRYVASGKIRLPSSMNETEFEELLRKLTRVDWNVKILNAVQERSWRSDLSRQVSQGRPDWQFTFSIARRIPRSPSGTDWVPRKAEMGRSKESEHWR